MKSIKEIYKIGKGPSSSHTMGPAKACEYMLLKNKDADEFIVYLYGSLAHTGDGHLTKQAILNVFKGKKIKIICDYKLTDLKHPNTMDIVALKNNSRIDCKRIISIGGGDIEIEGENKKSEIDIYNENTLDNIKEKIKEEKIDILEYIYSREDNNFKKYLEEVFSVMIYSLENSLNVRDGILPGKLSLKRRAREVYENKVENENYEKRKVRLLTSYALAVSEANASLGEIVTAPTCGACGVLPSVLYYYFKEKNKSKDEIVNALAIAGLIGNIVKQNASISGAECGCQAEIGTACSMAASAVSYLEGGNLINIENAAKIAMEHNLGLTCDPVLGYVQIPCIERNAVAAMKAVDAALLASLYKEKDVLSFDLVVKTMYETGKDLKSGYKETSKAGLAKKYLETKK